MPFLALLVALLPNGLVVLHLVFDHGVEDPREPMGRLGFVRRKWSPSGVALRSSD